MIAFIIAFVFNFALTLIVLDELPRRPWFWVLLTCLSTIAGLCAWALFGSLHTV